MIPYNKKYAVHMCLCILQTYFLAAGVVLTLHDAYTNVPRVLSYLTLREKIVYKNCEVTAYPLLKPGRHVIISDFESESIRRSFLLSLSSSELPAFSPFPILAAAALLPVKELLLE